MAVAGSVSFVAPVFACIIASSPPERIVASEFTRIGAPALTASGDYVYFTKLNADSRVQIRRQRLPNGQSEVFVPATAQEASRPQLSPDGRWIAFLTSEAGSTEVHVRSTDVEHSEDWRVAACTSGRTALRWSHAGDELFYVANGVMMAVRVTTAGSFSFQPPRPLFNLNGLLSASFDVGADGRFLMVRPRPALRPRSELVMLERWTDLLRK